MTKEGIEELKQKISDGWAMAHDPMCSAGFEAADKYIQYLEDQINIYLAGIDSMLSAAQFIKDSKPMTKAFGVVAHKDFFK